MNYRNVCQICQAVMYSRDSKPIEFCSQECLNQAVFKAGMIMKVYRPAGVIKIEFTVNPEKCECGGEKSNTTHSDWCPKHKK